MNTRRMAFVLAAAVAGMLGVAAAAWACVPGHDHGGAVEGKGHSLDPAVAPNLPVPTVVPVDAVAAASPTAFDTATAPGTTAEEGSSSRTIGYVVVALGGALLLAAILAGLRKWRSGAGPRPVVD
jgi:hypothetical protein